jgi:adenylate kinase
MKGWAVGPRGAAAGEPPPCPIAMFYFRPFVPMDMIVSITGTPGTGKSTVGAALRSRGRTVVEVGDLVLEHHLYEGVDQERDSLEVDPEVLAEQVPTLLPSGDVVLVGHLSHLIPVDLIVVLRCRPSVLEKRLLSRGWPPAKVRENRDAEALDVILVEAVESGTGTVEIDTTEMTLEQVAAALEEVLAGERDKYTIGNVDWSQEVLGWY